MIKDNLGICGEKISDAEHIATILNGLPSEFDSVVTLITTSTQAYDVLALSSMLIDLEVRQKSGVMGYQQPTEGVSDSVGYRGRGGSFHRDRGRGHRGASANLCSIRDVDDDNKHNVACVYVFANGSFVSLNVAIVGEHVWFPDSRATSHLIQDASSVINIVSYTGTSKFSKDNKVISNFMLQNVFLMMHALIKCCCKELCKMGCTN
ncbi:hypothetical protein GOBAR_AA23375 [Gossypium barbadense]|uniref:Uncharacterized protein n=1 Tax=Gossypium barbadense TaxID=3634 RepID=A0A2P5X1T3_GOSBA|nr:hypothetical protein GOBAR_AA23375 [Gossypium barbadense]